MKKVLFFTLFLMFSGAVCVNAQVTIGNSSAPHPGAVLDLKSSTKGMKLPRVDIQNVNVFQLSEDKLDEAVGMIIYNTNDATVGGQGKGVYVWDGEKWIIIQLTSGCTVPAVPGPITLPSQVNVGASFNVSVPTVANATSYEWSFPSEFTITQPGNTATITVTANTSGTYQANRISVKAKNDCGESNPANASNAIRVVCGTLSISDQSEYDSYVAVDGTIMLSVTASVSGGPGEVQYQWYSNTTPGTDEGGTALSGETNNTYTASAASTGVCSYYYCKVYSSCDPTDIIFAYFTVNVDYGVGLSGDECAYLSKSNCQCSKGTTTAWIDASEEQRSLLSWWIAKGEQSLVRWWYTAEQDDSVVIYPYSPGDPLESNSHGVMVCFW